ncbi:chorismate mutase [Desulfotomaculum nigrificans CO-1-SRB]|uniref:chorismate mutase n=1 Tax=Desulfotomaculum nigrificans (strain DSM 14880 / VKM B-2319 / CO-1-SRB) TaxID=868595 RepID=F6B991_DESCC|nr:chorismate mutase [Desulfotomaculum nigrificans]AEF94863.1 chorismate mutase [Desulfotomaculum nigrificans CO-1-SRB]
MAFFVRGIRGATTVERNEAQEIFDATQELLRSILEQNQINIEDICSVFFTVTPDLNAAFPARAARAMGWDYVPLMCALESDVVGALPKCIRVLVHVNTSKGQKEMKHVYLRQAINLRPDLVH